MVHLEEVQIASREVKGSHHRASAKGVGVRVLHGGGAPTLDGLRPALESFPRGAKRFHVTNTIEEHTCILVNAEVRHVKMPVIFNSNLQEAT